MGGRQYAKYSGGRPVALTSPLTCCSAVQIKSDIVMFLLPQKHKRSAPRRAAMMC